MRESERAVYVQRAAADPNKWGWALSFTKQIDEHIEAKAETFDRDFVDTFTKALLLLSSEYLCRPRGSSRGMMLDIKDGKAAPIFGGPSLLLGSNPDWNKKAVILSACSCAEAMHVQSRYIDYESRPRRLKATLVHQRRLRLLSARSRPSGRIVRGTAA